MIEIYTSFYGYHLDKKLDDGSWQRIPDCTHIDIFAVTRYLSSRPYDTIRLLEGDSDGEIRVREGKSDS